MISRSHTRLTLKTALEEQTEKDGCKYRYPMTKFRHAIFEAVDICRTISECKWDLDIDAKLCKCTFFTRTTEISCTYNYQTDEVTVEKEGAVIKIDVSELPSVLKKLQPVYKVVLKRK